VTDRIIEPKEIIMKGIRHIRRLAAVLAGMAGVLLACAATPAFASVPHPDPAGAGDPAPVFPAPVHTITLVTGGGMPGWQIALIAIGAALFAAMVAVLLDRVRAARRNAVTAAT
jgi:hypothetical protein